MARKQRPGRPITREMIGAARDKFGNFKTRAILPGQTKTQARAYALAATPPPSTRERERHSGYSLPDLILRCWAVGVPVWGADVLPNYGRIGRIEYSNHMARRRGVHQFEHAEPLGALTGCAGHAGTPCDATAPSAGDSTTRWRNDIGDSGPNDADVPSLARRRLADVRTELGERFGEPDIEATPSIAQVVGLLESAEDHLRQGTGNDYQRGPHVAEGVRRHDHEFEQAIRRGIDPARRRAVERRAMEAAILYYRNAGWSVEDVSANESFDLRCVHDGTELHVEVKGLSAEASEVALTRNEVEHASRHRTDLFVVSEIEVEHDGVSQPTASGGRCSLWESWEPDNDALTAITYRYSLPEPDERPAC